MYFNNNIHLIFNVTNAHCRFFLSRHTTRQIIRIRHTSNQYRQSILLLMINNLTKTEQITGSHWWHQFTTAPKAAYSVTLNAPQWPLAAEVNASCWGMRSDRIQNNYTEFICLFIFEIFVYLFFKIPDRESNPQPLNQRTFSQVFYR